MTDTRTHVGQPALERLLALYANHAPQCNCFICRHLTANQRQDLTDFWDGWGGRKSRTNNPYSPQRRAQ